jgi:hypothetical protein
LEQALHVLQLRPSFIQPVSSQRRQTGSLRGRGVAVLTATCLLVSSLSRFPIAVVSSMIDPFIVSPSVVLFVKWAAPICLRRGYPTAPDSIARVRIARAAALLVLISRQHMPFANAGLRGEVYLMLMSA